MTTKHEFFITLPSNVKSDNNENTITHYKTPLKKRLIFPQNEEWKVGLAEIMYPKSWFNIKESCRLHFMRQNGLVILFEDIPKPQENGILDQNEFINYIEAGYYSSIEELIEKINRKLFYLCPGNNQPELKFNKNKNTAILICGKTQDNEKFIPVFTAEINRILGFIDDYGLSFHDKLTFSTYSKKSKKTDNQRKILSQYKKVIDEFQNYLERGYIVGPMRTDIKAGLSSIYIYSNIVEHSIVGDAYAQLLRTIPINDQHKWGDVIHHDFDKPHFIPLQARNFDTIEIDIKDDTGKRIPFQIGRVVVKLVFRRYD